MQHIDAVRRFNRFYTRHADLLRHDYLGSPFNLAEARLVYELGQRESAIATTLGRELGFDLGYLSRLLQGLKRRGLVQSRRAPHDARQALLSLTEKGRKASATLNGRSREKTATMLSPLHTKERQKLVAALQTVELLLSFKNETKREKAKISLRSHRPGDMGWVTHRHGVLYHEEYGWDERFEALVAGIVAKFIEGYDPARERCWIAEMDGEPVGSVFLVRNTRTEAKLRLLLIEPKARGLGLGKRLVRECIDFARAKGYRRLVLWTQSNLVAARGIYKDAGFRLAKREPHRSFGAKLMGEYWELKL